MKEADRYTVLTVNLNDLAERLKSCGDLGLHFFVKKFPGYRDTCLLYVFFDEGGMSNYLAGHYDEPEVTHE